MPILYNIKKVVLTELDDSTGAAKSGRGVSHIKTAQKAELEPVLSEGDEDILRSPEQILAVVRTDDLIYGYDVKLTDNTFSADVAGLVGGYKVSGGLHGVGASVVNALSKWVEVKVYKNGKIYFIRFENSGHTVEPLKVIGDCEKNRTGTVVTFKPDPEIFDTDIYDIPVAFEVYQKWNIRKEKFVNKTSPFIKDVSILKHSLGIGKAESNEYILYKTEKLTLSFISNEDKKSLAKMIEEEYVFRQKQKERIAENKRLNPNNYDYQDLPVISMATMGVVYAPIQILF